MTRRSPPQALMRGDRTYMEAMVIRLQDCTSGPLPLPRGGLGWGPLDESDRHLKHS
ncbi:MAG: hypothetical protein ACRC8Y_27240 [Chroococcales cyanobacterium]